MLFQARFATCVQSARPIHARIKDPAAGQTWRGSGVVVSLIATLLLAAATAEAGSGHQGARWQGARWQGARWQGASLAGMELRDGWLQGSHLAATLADGRPVAITDFAGRTIRAVDLSLGAPETVELSPADLVGMAWTARLCIDDQPCQVITYRVAAAAQDDSLSTMPLYPDNRDVGLYQIEYSLTGDPESDDWLDPCVDSDMQMGIFVNGRWRPDGAWTPGGYTFSCAAGVIAKCARSWGYKPWKILVSPTHGPVRLDALHRACVRAARADYCGDGQSHTVDGTLIDMYDRYGFNVPEPDLHFAPEAGFDPGGAVWARHPRVVGGPADSDQPGVPACRRRLPGPGRRSAPIEVRSRPSHRAPTHRAPTGQP